MPAAPKAANVSRPDPAETKASKRWPAARRLRSAAQFAAVTSDPQALRAGRRWLSLAGRVQPGGAAVPVRFGFTAARRFARRAVDRNTVKRVLREAARHKLVELDEAAERRSVDIVMRLKAGAPAQGRIAWMAELRAEADSLLAELARRLRQGRSTP